MKAENQDQDQERDTSKYSQRMGKLPHSKRDRFIFIRNSCHVEHWHI